MSNLADRLARAATRRAGHTVVRLDDDHLTYAQLDEASARFAGMLAGRGIGPGDRIGVMMPNVPQFPVAYYGALRAGAVVVPMNPLLKAREVAYYLDDAGARAIFAWTGCAEESAKGAAETGAEAVVVTPEFEAALSRQSPLTRVADRAPDDTAVILYTSGTTGRPKGAELTHANLGRNADASVQLFDAGPDDVIFGGLPLFHSFGQTCGLNTAVTAGATITLLPRFDPSRAFEILERDRVTIFEAVPTMYVALLQHPEHDAHDLGRLRLCVSGGASLPVEVLRELESAFGAMILEGYGLSETSPVASFNHRDRERKPGSIGTPIEGVEFRLIDDAWADVSEGDVGEIAIRGHNVMKGYWNQPDATAASVQGGWFRTGDLARRDADGFYYIVDRKKDMVVRGGFNVYPREIEEVLYEHPAVAEAAVIGVPHATHGEEVAAAVVLKEGAAVDIEELRDHVKDRVAAYKYPRHVWLVDALPKGPTGKIQKGDIIPPGDVAGTAP
jgi:long-chain acyl-CoA synthetase